MSALVPYKGTAPAPNLVTAGDLTSEHLKRHIVVNDDSGGERARGILQKIGHEVDFHGDPVTWLAITMDDWRWYKQVPANTVVRL